jgi:hypothetical protein
VGANGRQVGCTQRVHDSRGVSKRVTEFDPGRSQGVNVWRTLAAPSTAQKPPAGHAVQAVMPGSWLKDPREQPVQAEALLAMAVLADPGEHGTQLPLVGAPATGWKVPGWHSLGVPVASGQYVPAGHCADRANRMDGSIGNGHGRNDDSVRCGAGMAPGQHICSLCERSSSLNSTRRHKDTCTH